MNQNEALAFLNPAQGNQLDTPIQQESMSPDEKGTQLAPQLSSTGMSQEDALAFLGVNQQQQKAPIPDSSYLNSQIPAAQLPASDPNNLTSNYTESIPQPTPQASRGMSKEDALAFLGASSSPTPEQSGKTINLPATSIQQQTQGVEPTESAKHPVGFLEAAGRGLIGGLAKTNELMAKGVGIFPYVEDKTLQAFGIDSNIYNRYMNAVHATGLGKPTEEAEAIKPTEQLTTGGQIGLGLGEMGSQLPYMAMTGGIGAEEAAAQNAFQVVKPLMPRITESIQAMIPMAAQAGADAVEQSAQQGDNPIVQTAKGIAQATATAAIGVVPLSARSKIVNPLGRLLEQGAYGYITGLPIGEQQKVVDSWVNGKPYVPSEWKDMAIQAIPMAFMTGAFGVLHAPKAQAKIDAASGGPETTLTPSKNPVVNEREAKINAMADAQATVPEAPNPIKITPKPTAKPPAADLRSLIADQAMHDEGSPEWNAIQKQIDALNKPSEVKASPKGTEDALASKWSEMQSYPEGSPEREKAFQEYIDISSGKTKPAEAPVAEAQPTQPNAIQEPSTTEAMLRPQITGQGEVVELPRVGEGNAKVPAQETKAQEIAPTEPAKPQEVVLTEEQQAEKALLDKIDAEAGKPKAPKPKAKEVNPYSDILYRYENGEENAITSPSDLVKEVEKIAKRQRNQNLKDAITRYRDATDLGADVEPEVERLLNEVKREADRYKSPLSEKAKRIKTAKDKAIEVFGDAANNLNYVLENKILDPAQYRKRVKAGLMKKGGEYDFFDKAKLPKKVRDLIFSRDGSPIDEVAGIMRKTPYELLEAIQEAYIAKEKLDKDNLAKEKYEEEKVKNALKMEQLKRTNPEEYDRIAEEDARNFLNSRLMGEGGFIQLPDFIQNAVVKVGESVRKEVSSFKDWSTKMISRLGKGVRGLLKDIWSKVRDNWNKDIGGGFDTGGRSLDKAAEEAKFAPKPLTDKEKLAKKVADAFTKGKMEPVTEEELENVLAKKFPNITPSEISDLHAMATGKPKPPVAEAPTAPQQREMFPQRTPIGISKEAVENQRLARMLENLPESEREPNAAKISDALEKNKNPQIVEGLIHDIIDGGKTIATDQEVALLNVEMNRLQLERERIQNNFDQTEKRPSDYSVLNQELKPIDDKIDRLERAVDKIGTSAGRLLQMFKIMLAEDYSPVALERKAVRDLRRDLTPDEKETIARQAKEIKELQDKLNKKQGEVEEKDLSSSVKDAYERQIAELKEQAKPDPVVQNILKNIANALKSPADAARERMAKRRKERGGRLFTGVDPDVLADIADAAIIGAEKIAKGASNLARWTSEMKSEFGDGIIPHLKEIWNKSLENFKNASNKPTERVSVSTKKKLSNIAKEELTKDDIINRAKAEAEAGEELSHKTVYDLARAHILEGVRGEDNVMKAVHDDIKEAYPGATERDVRRAFSEYGKAKFPSAEEDKVHLRQLRTLVRLQESIDRLKEGLPALRTGLQRDRANQSIREKTAILNNLLKQVKVEPTEQELTSRLEAKKNALRNRIEDLDAQLQGKAKPVEKGTPVPLDAEAERLTSLRDAMQQKLREIESAERKAAKEKADAEDADKQRREAQAEIDRIQKSIDDVNDRIASGEKIAPTPKKQPLTEYARLLKEDLKKARKQYQKVIAEPSKSPEEKYNERRQAKIKQDIADIEDRMRRGDYSKKEKKPLNKKYPETELLEKKLADKRREADLWREEKEKQERPIWEKALRTTSETAREITVAGINVLYKIGKYAIAKPITTPIGEIAGYTARNLLGLGKVRGEYESGASPLKTIPAYYRGYWKAMKQFFRVLKSGHSDSELLYDKKKQNNTNWFRWIGSNLHAAIKNLPSTAKEELYREHLYANAIADGLIDPKNPNDPKNQMAMAGLNLKAYLASKAERLQEDNKIAEGINNIHRWAESPDKEGKINPYTSAVSHGIKIAITKGIYKIGLNYLKQAAQAGTGLGRGVVSTLNAHWNGLDTLTPKEMDYITKAFKVGAVPAALMAWAVIDAFKDDKDKVFGGYYEQGRKKGDVKWGDVRINGKQFSLHIPEVEAAQFVNTMARDFRKNASKTDIGMNGVEAFFDAMKGVFSEAPVTGPVTEIAKSPKSFAGYMYQGLVPSAVRDIAKMRDVNAEGEPNYRYPRTSWENIEKGIPGLRETLPTKPQRSSSSSNNPFGLKGYSAKPFGLK